MVAADAFDTVDPIVMVQARSVIAALILGALAYVRRQTDPHHSLAELAGLGLILAAVTILFYWAIDRLGVGPGVTIQFLGPALVLGWMRLAQRRRVPSAAWGAAGVALVGTALMSRVWDLARLDLPGLAAAIGAAVTFAAYLAVGERLSARIPALTVAAYGLAWAALFWVAAVPVRIPDAGVWWHLAWVGVLGTAAPFLLEMAALRRADPGTVGVAASAEPVIAAVTAWIFIGQRLTWPQIAGGALVVVGIGTIQLLMHSVAPDLPQAV